MACIEWPASGIVARSADGKHLCVASTILASRREVFSAVCHAERSTSITSKIGIIVPPVARISFLWLTVSEPLAAILEFDLLLRIKAHFTLQETKKPAHHRLKIAGAAGSELSISYPPLRNASGSFVWPQIMSEACSIDGGGLLLRLRYHTHGVRQDLCISG